MKFRKSIAGIYGAALVAGLTLLVGPQLQPTSGRTPVPTVVPTQTPNTDLTPVPTESLVGSVQTPVPTEAPNPLLQDVLYPVTEEALTTFITDYLNAYYTNDSMMLSTLVSDASMINTSRMESDADGFSEITDLTLFSRPGFREVQQVIYASYTVNYDDSRSPLPLFSEFYLVNNNGHYMLFNGILTPDTEDALMAARQTDTVMKLAVSSLIRRYHNACLDGNEDLLKKNVKNPSFLDMDYLESRFHYTESFDDYDITLFSGINEIDYIVIATYSEKLVLIDTPAPCMESYFIHLDTYTATPYIYLGVISKETEAFTNAIIQTPLVQELAEQTNKAMEDALLKDDDLKSFYQRLSEGSNQQ